MDIIATHTGQILQVHDPLACAGHACCVHAPSPHPLDCAPLHWHPAAALMLRICAHGIGHPDPDNLMAVLGAGWPVSGAHGCDGCCRPEQERMAAT